MHKRGFTLFEMMVSIGIFVLITSIGIVNYRKFGNDIFITNLAYDVGLSIRKAQSFGINVKEAKNIGTDPFRFAYGVHFDKAITGRYQLFVDAYGADPSCTNESIGPDRKWNCSNEDVEVYSLLKNSKIHDLCAVIAEESTCTSVDTLDITFLRPNPDAIITTSAAGTNTYSRAEIVIKSADNRQKKIVVYAVGQISIQTPTP
jgi:prepilin-type N-terminal cleavage/methylation domain-containing protein